MTPYRSIGIGIGASLGICILIAFFVGVVRYSQAHDPCYGKTEEQCIEIIKEACRGKLTAFNEDQRRARIEWERSHEKEKGTASWSTQRSAIIRDANEKRAAFVKNLRQGKCRVLSQNEMPKETESGSGTTSSLN
jgi:hypothetical protein